MGAVGVVPSGASNQFKMDLDATTPWGEVESLTGAILTPRKKKARKPFHNLWNGVPEQDALTF